MFRRVPRADNYEIPVDKFISGRFTAKTRDKSDAKAKNYQVRCSQRPLLNSSAGIKFPGRPDASRRSGEAGASAGGAVRPKSRSQRPSEEVY